MFYLTTHSTHFIYGYMASVYTYIDRYKDKIRILISPEPVRHLNMCVLSQNPTYIQYIFKCIKYIDTYKHIHTYTHTNIHTYMNTYIHTHTYIHTYIHTNKQTYIHTWIHTYIHTHIHTYISVFQSYLICTDHH